MNGGKIIITIICIFFINIIYVSAQIAAPAQVPQVAVEKGIEEEETAYKTGVYQLEGIASYYGDDFQNKLTANGEIFNMNAFTAAHRTLPFNTVVEVTNEKNGRAVTVRINDRGPYLKNRVIDLSKEAAKALGMIESGTTPVSLRVVYMGKKKARAIENVSGQTEYHADNIVKIQVASYTNVENAKHLVNTLVKLGFDSSIERYNSYFRVVVDNVEPANLNDSMSKLKKIGFRNLMVKDIDY